MPKINAYWPVVHDHEKKIYKAFCYITYIKYVPLGVAIYDPTDFI